MYHFPLGKVQSSPASQTDDPQVQLKLLKRELKAWENAFAEREGRKPGSNDIKADKDIGEAPVWALSEPQHDI